ncbi:MAG: thioredoxin domain-containing protein, partial [Chloroflexota bacterium]|nr:thioredoxin domain-containing protein [Chloroflexota bacterium]
MNDSIPDPTAESVADPVPPVPVAPMRPDTVRRQNGLAMLGTVALAVVLAFGGGLVVGRATAPGGASAPSDPGATPGPVPTVVPSAGVVVPHDGARLGRADAKVTIEYWADYQCPYCAKFAQEVIPQLESRIADGTIALVHRDFAFLGPESVDAAIAVHCAAREDKYWVMHDAVYAAQNGENRGGFARPRLAQVAASVGLDAT